MKSSYLTQAVNIVTNPISCIVVRRVKNENRSSCICCNRRHCRGPGSWCRCRAISWRGVSLPRWSVRNSLARRLSLRRSLVLGDRFLGCDTCPDMALVPCWRRRRSGRCWHQAPPLLRPIAVSRSDGACAATPPASSAESSGTRWSRSTRSPWPPRAPTARSPTCRRWWRGPWCPSPCSAAPSGSWWGETRSGSRRALLRGHAAVRTCLARS